MKQTNNAIKFLLAQYRAIFKHAYLKGLASAVVLTAGLAAGATANADSINSGSSLTSDITVDGSKNETFELAESGEVTWTGAITLQGVTEATIVSEGTGALEINKSSNSGSLILDTSNLSIGGSEGAVTVNLDKLSGSAGSTITLTGAASSKTVTLDANTLNLGGANVVLVGDAAGAAKISGQLENNSTGNVNVSGANDIIDVYTANNESATLNVTVDTNKSGSIIFSTERKQLDLVNSQFNVNGDLTITSGSVSLSGGESSVTLADGASLTIKGSTTAGSLSATQFSLAKGSSITLSGDTSVAASIAGQLTAGSTGNITTKSNTTNVNLYTAEGQSANVKLTVSGTANISLEGEGKDTLKLSGDNTDVSISGVLNVKKGTLDLTDAKSITASAQSSDATSGSITIAKDSTLKVDSDKLTSFLNGTSKGTATIAASGTLALSSANSIDLHDFTFSGSTGTSGSIVALSAGALLSGDSLTASATVENAANLTVKANSFTVGQSDSNAAVNLSFKDINVADTLNFVGNDNLTVSGSFVLDSADSGSVTDELGDGKKVVLSGSKVDVNGGAWTSTADMQLGDGSSSSGTITITASEGKTPSLIFSGSTLILASGSVTVDGKGASLDMTSGTLSASTSSTAKIEVKNSGSFSVKGEDLSKVLASGTGLTLSGDGANANVSGDLTVADDKFNKLVVNTGTSLKAGNFTVTDASTDGITLTGLAGTISANTVTFTPSTGADSLKVTGSTGKIVAESGLNSSAALTVENLNLDLGSTAQSSGSINNALTVGSGSTVNVFGSNWTGSNLTVSGGALNVGSSDVAGNLTLSDKLTNNAGTVTVAKDSALTATQIETATNTNLTVNGTVTINGKDTKEEIEIGSAGYMGFNQQGTTTIDGGKFIIGQTAADKMLNTEWKPADTSTQAAGDQGYVYNNFGTYTLKNQGTLALNFSQGEFSADQLKQLKQELVDGVDTDGIIKDGIIDIGKALITDIGDALVDSGEKDSAGNTIYTMDWNDYQAVAKDGNLSGVINDQLENTVVENVNSPVTGNMAVGAIQSTGNSATIQSGSSLTLVNAEANGGKFVSTSTNENGSVIAQAGSSLALQGNGSIGEVTLEAGSDTDETTLALQQKTGSTETTTITVAGVNADSTTIADNTKVTTAQNVNVKFTDNVNADVLDFKGDVTFADKKSAHGNELNTAANTTFTAYDLTVEKQANIQGTLKVANNLTLTSQETSDDAEHTPIKATVAGDVQVGNNLTATQVAFTNKLTQITKEFKANSVELGEDSTLTAANASFAGTNDIAGYLDVSGTVTLNASSNTDISGTLKAATLKFDENSTGAQLTVSDGQVTVKDFTGVDGTTIRVGNDGDDAASGTLEVTGTMTLGGSTLIVDPEYDQASALVAIKSLGSSSKNKQDVGIFDGNVIVGQNSALGVGVTLAQLRDVIAQYQVDGHFQDPADNDSYGAMLYLDKPVSIANGKGIYLTADVADPSKVTADTIYFGEGTALGVNTNNAQESGSYITFLDSTGKSVAGNLTAAGGDIVLFGDKYQKSYQLFMDGTSIKDVNGTDATIDVLSANGFLKGQLNKDGTVSLQIDKNNMGVMMAGTSTPVQQTIVAYSNGYNGDYADEAAAIADGAQLGTKNETTGKYEYNNYFLSQVLLGGRAADVEKVARLGVYGGVAQAALTAGASTYEAVNGRMGIGAQTGSITFADNGQGAGLWVTPVYKNHDSDGFDAQGVSYGADLDLYGVALGGDYTLANGLRVGAAFNVGSGDADGQGAGAGVSNDFDYYGFTVYGGYTLDKLSVVADISYTAIDNDVEANTGVEKVTASMDSSNLSVGVTGQYAFDMNGVSVTPHAGLRYTYIDMDDYTVKGSEDIAKYSADSASVFSIPVGVTFAKDIVSGDWTIKPALDLTLTANMGDDSVDGSVTWAGVENLKTNLESEVIDNFTYGATLGVSAKSGNMSFGFGVNYTGASSADEYGVSANARFVF